MAETANVKMEDVSALRVRLVVDPSGTVHFPGGFVADTSTLCGQHDMAFEPAPQAAVKITCDGCRELFNNVIGHWMATDW